MVLLCGVLLDYVPFLWNQVDLLFCSAVRHRLLILAPLHLFGGNSNESPFGRTCVTPQRGVCEKWMRSKATDTIL